MSEADDQKTTRSRPLLRWALWIVGLLVVYVLSFGPAFILFRHDVIPKDVYVIIYRPLIWWIDHGGGGPSAPLINYLRWWVDHLS